LHPPAPRPSLRACDAPLARAEATAANAEQDVTRYKGLVAQQALSQQEYDAAVARLRTAQADVAQRRAEVQAARLSLGYTTVTAPIAGRAGRAMVTEGALVSGNGATLLTRIEQLDPIYANFSQSSAQVLALRNRLASGELESREMRQVPVHLVLEDGSTYRYPGTLDFVGLSIDEATGTAALRAEFPNPQRTLLPGQFVRLRVETGLQSTGVRVPQRAVTVTAQGANVLVVGAKDVVESRPVKLGALEGGWWIVQDGLVGGERVIVDGLQKATPGQPVKAEVASMTPPAVPADTAAPAPARPTAAR
jgi:membrane fusion protein (multidrug efflux system)